MFPPCALSPRFRASAAMAGLFCLAGSAAAEQVVISEVHYAPLTGKPEFIEIQNLTATIFDIAEWRFTDGVDYQFPAFDAGNTDRTFLKAFERILVTGVDEAALRAAYPIPPGTRVYGQWTGLLSNGGETVTLKDKNGILMAEVSYGDDGRKWPVSPDGAGHSLELVRENAGAGDWRNWAASASPGGTPGTAPVPVDPLTDSLVLNEVHFSAEGAVDWVELRNTSGAAVNVNGLRLAGAVDFAGAVDLTGTVAAGGVGSWDVAFPADADGGVSIFLVKADGTVLGAQKFDRRGDVSVESFQAEDGDWYAGPGATRNAANVPVRNDAIVINEIMFDAPSDARNSEFVELYNRSASPVDLGGWRFVDGISYEFPAGTVLPAGGYAVVAADPAFIAEHYAGLAAYGPFSGGLSDTGELLRLEDARRNPADEVDYKPGGDWPDLADGDGTSMELKHPDMDNRYPTAWADSDEAGKNPLQTFTYTAPFERATWSPVTSGQELHMFLVGDSHIVLQNVAVRLNGTGANLVTKPDIQSTDYSSAKGWVFQGTHWASYIDGADIHLIADGHGDNKANRGEVDLGTLTVGQSYTLSFDARWVSGKPRLIVQTLDHGFGTSFALPVPNNPGTPGMVNTALLANPAPALRDVVHSPAVPKPADPVKITARVATAGVASPVVEAVHRADNAAGTNAWVRTGMRDDGTGGDAVAGDGIFTATLTQYTTQAQIAQFYVEATAAGGEKTRMPQFGPDRPALFMKDSRTMPTTLLRERYIMTLRDRNALTATGNTATYGYDFPRMSNHFFNATMISNESEVRYNAGIRKSGSPFTRDTGSALGHGKTQLPGDRLFRQRGKTVIDPSGASVTPRYYDDRIARYFLYLMGLPVNEMEYAHLAINGDGFALRELHEPIANDFLDRCFADGSKGTLLRIDDEWRFPNDTGDDGRSSRSADWSYKNSDDPIRYHSEWIMRSREADYDYASFIEFVRAVGRNQFTESGISRIANRDMLCLSAAVRGYDADWDTLTMDRGKNAYFYRPPDGTWMLLHWDGDRVFEDSSRGFLGGLPGIQTYFNKPYNRRVLNYFLTELLNRYTKGSVRTEAWMQAEKAAVAGSGIVMSDALYRSWFTSRETPARNFIGAPRTAAFAVTTSTATTTETVVSLNGTSPSSVYQVRVAGQPWALATWSTTTAWKLEGVILRNGSNTITVEGVNHQGLLIESTQFTITKDGNALPIVAMEAAPASFHVAMSEPVALDAADSYDPEGTALTFAWSAPPADTSLQSAAAQATASFFRPGLYPVTVSATDAAGGTAGTTREVAVYGPGGFTSFSTDVLASRWKLANVRARNNLAADSWFSLETTPGRLHLHVPPDRAYPAGTPQNPLPNPITYVDYGATWSFDDSNTERGTDFAQPAFDDAAWQSGPGLLGADTNAFLPAPGIQTAMARDFASGLLTYYLRTEFNFDRDPVGARVIMDTYADDGARFFLNGQEIGRVRLPAGVIDKDTPASSLSEATAGNPAIDTAVVDTDGSGFLVTGTNVLAVDVHNSSAGSSDVVFGAQLSIASQPLGTGGGGLAAVIHPWVKRDLPAATDWVLETDLELSGIQSGDFTTGLLVEVVRENLRFRYGIGYQGGNAVAVTQVTPTGSTGTLASVVHNQTDGAVVRIQRAGNDLIFSCRTGTAFTEIYRLTLPAGSRAVEGGPFATTDSPETLDVLFDYVMLIDPATTSSAADELVLSEVMYKPEGGDAYEFLELFNNGSTPVDLTGFRFPQGEPFDEFVFPARTIQPGAYVLVVNDLAAFRSRYGTSRDSLIAGEWAGGSLSNSGETITLLDAEGLVVLSFTYSDEAPWPIGPDTTGASLILTDPGTGNTGNGAHYSASAAVGGSPGTGETADTPFALWMAARGQADPLAVRAGEPLNNLLTYALGLDLAGGNLAAVQPEPGTVLVGAVTHITFRYPERSGDPTIGYALEWSFDGTAWESAAASVEDTAVTPGADGTDSVLVRFDEAFSTGPRRFVRLRITVP